jgi:VanZ family protein
LDQLIFSLLNSYSSSINRQPQRSFINLPSSIFFPRNSYRRTPRRTAARKPALLRAWLPVLAFACIFAIESTAAFGADHTSMPLHTVFHGIFGSAVDGDWGDIHHILRKTGHFTGYGTFSLVCFRAFWLTLRNRTTQLPMRLGRRLACHGLAIATTFCVASADELHQSFLPNRTGIFSDVLLDTTGALLLQIVLFLVLKAITSWPKRPGTALRNRNASLAV